MKLLYKNAPQKNLTPIKKVLIHTYSVGYLYTQLAVIKNLFGDCQIDVILSSFSDSTTTSVLEMAQDIDFLNNVWVISEQYIKELEMMQYQSENLFLNKIKGILHGNLMSEDYDAIVYVHDVINSLIGILKACYPKAQLITVGDGSGAFNDKEIWKQHYKAKINKNNIFEFVIPDIAINILPVQVYKKDFFEKTQLKILPKEDYLESFKLAPNIYKQKNDYLNKLLSQYSDKVKCFLISENYAQAKMLSYEDEMTLSSEFIKQYCPKNSVVFIKPHPLENIFKIEEYKTILGDNWEIVELDKTFATYPVEMLSDLIKSCDVIISSGAARLTLKYLYNRDVICPFCKDEALYLKYFKEDKYHAMRFIIDYTDKPLKALGNWDMKSLLYSNIRED